jgi:hypothetical protein
MRKNAFSSRKSAIFRNENRCFESADFAILSLARLPIPPPWLVDFDFRFAICNCKGSTGCHPVAFGSLLNAMEMRALYAVGGEAPVAGADPPAGGAVVPVLGGRAAAAAAAAAFFFAAASAASVSFASTSAASTG